MPKVELVYDRECPNVALARANLLQAFVRAGIPPRWSEHLQDEAPAHARGYGSPTILVDGRDVAGASAGAQECCRLYATRDGALVGVPDVTSLTDAIAAAARSKRT